MAKLSSLFDATKVEPNKAFGIIPKGKYPAQIVKSEMKPTKDAKGSYLALELEIVSGEYKSQRLFERLNLKNANAKAVEIAQATLSAICHATGVMRVSDTLELHNRPMLVSVVVEPAQFDAKGKLEYDEKNEVKGYEPLEGAAPVTAGNAAPGWAGKSPAENVAPAAAPAAPAKKAPPGKKAAPAAAPAVVVVSDTTPYWVEVEGENLEKTGDEIRAMLADGMPPETPVCKDGDDEWHDATHYGLTEPAVAAEAPAPAAIKAPWNKKK